MKTQHVQTTQASEEHMAQAAQIIRQGGLVVFPTETVYGLGADATNDRAIARIFEAKGRPHFNPLIVHAPDLQAAEQLAVFSDVARALAAQFWPGPLTLVLKRRDDCPASKLVSAGLDTIAVRVPDHPVGQALLRASERVIAAPSANKSGSVSPTRATHVLDSLQDGKDMILDGGPCRVGLESTVVDVSGDGEPALLRYGSITTQDLEPITGPLIIAGEDAHAPRSPGQLLKHYAPSIPVRLDATEAMEGEALLGLGDMPHATLNLSPEGYLTDAAANLFAMLHTLDQGDYTGIAISAIPEKGLGRAINDRLRRAAAGSKNLGS